MFEKDYTVEELMEMAMAKEEAKEELIDFFDEEAMKEMFGDLY